MTPSSRDRCAAALFQAAIDVSCKLGVEPERLAPVLQAALLRTYGVPADAPAPVVLRVMEAWKPTTRALADDGALRVVSTECPILAQARADPKACDACRLLQRELLAIGLDAPPEAIEFEKTVVRGDPECEARVRGVTS